MGVACWWHGLLLVRDVVYQGRRDNEILHHETGHLHDIFHHRQILCLRLVKETE